MDINNTFKEMQELIETKLKEILIVKEPTRLYEPLDYFISDGGKRIRPILTMGAAGAAGGNPEDALLAGCAIEIMHNFTLAHDDIMDNSDFRRGKPTIHKKWNESVAILAGDVMLGVAYDIIPPHKNYYHIIKTITKGLIEVCEGQVLDMEFNERHDVSMDEYKLMISKKTAALLQTCAVAGAYCADADNKKIEILSNYAKFIGLAFQIQDDMLDMLADEAKLGKKNGLDIEEGKKTYLIIKANELATKQEHRELLSLFNNSNGLSADFVPKFRNMFEEIGVFEQAKEEVDDYFKLAEDSIAGLEESSHKDMLNYLISILYKRNY